MYQLDRDHKVQSYSKGKEELPEMMENASDEAWNLECIHAFQRKTTHEEICSASSLLSQKTSNMTEDKCFHKSQVLSFKGKQGLTRDDHP